MTRRSRAVEALPYFQSDAAVAAYLDMTLSEFLDLRNKGQFAPTPKPRDPTLVYYKEDVDWWLSNSRPVAYLDRNIK